MSVVYSSRNRFLLRVRDDSTSAARLARRGIVRFTERRVAVRPIRIGTAARFVCVTLYVSRDRLEAR